MLEQIAEEYGYKTETKRVVFPHLESVKDELVPKEHKKGSGSGTVHVYIANSPSGTQQYLRDYFGEVSCSDADRPVVNHYFFADNIRYLMFEHLLHEENTEDMAAYAAEIRQQARGGLLTATSNFCFSGTRPYFKKFSETFHDIREFFLPKETGYRFYLFEPQDPNGNMGCFWFFSYEQVSIWEESLKQSEEAQAAKVDRPPSKPVSAALSMYKPFIILSGISGTGKTRFVRKQAEQTGTLKESYCLVPVRPDWHEPTDLLGYVSRISKDNQPTYITTKVLQFIVKAWKEIFHHRVSDGTPNHLTLADTHRVRPFWLCLDEMNLAPIEQYFADYLSIIETREWKPQSQTTSSDMFQVLLQNQNRVYACDPLLDLSPWLAGNGREENRALLRKLRNDLNLSDGVYDDLWAHFLRFGIGIPFNLMLVGTVNMDDTTHPFSRKVLDRAIVLDFLEFFPTDFDAYFDAEYSFQPLCYPLISNAQFFKGALPQADNNDGNGLSVDFLQSINRILAGSPFELSYRALNELLLAVISLAPADHHELHAIWDDFLMQKVLPRIEGDKQKLRVVTSDESKNKSILDVLEERVNATFEGEERRDFYRKAVGETERVQIAWRSPQKIRAMKNRLRDLGFTSYWT